MKLCSITKPMTVVSIALLFVLAGNTEAQAGKVAQIKAAVAHSPLGAKALNQVVTWSAIVLLSTTAITGKVLAQNGDVSSSTQQAAQSSVAIDQNVTYRIPLYEAVRKLAYDYSDYTEIEELLETGEVDVNARDEEGNTGLHIMVQEGVVSVDLLKLLLAHELDATLVNNAGKTAQAYVSDMFGGEPEAMREEALWTKAIYGINGKDADGKTPLDHALDWAEYDGDMELAQQLMAEGATISSVERALVLRVGKDMLMETMKREGEGDITSFLKLKKQHKHLSMRQGEHFLELAVESGDVAVAEFLLARGVIPNFIGKSRLPPLSLAAASHDGRVGLAMVSILLARGANGNYKSRDGSTAYHCTKIRKNTRPEEAATHALLLLAAVGAEGKDREGRTPMHWAELSGSETIRKIVASEIGITKLSDREMRERVYQELREAEGQRGLVE